jgi:hypothetical protein
LIFPSVSQIWSCLEIIVHRAISSSLGVIALFEIDQEQQDKLVQPCIAAIRYAEAACSSGTFEFNPLLRQPITLTTHYSDSPYFRQPIILLSKEFSL